MKSDDLVIWSVRLGNTDWIDEHPEIQEITVAAKSAEEAISLAIEWEKESIGDGLVVMSVKIQSSFVVRQ